MLISNEFRALNARLHVTEPHYGAHAREYAKPVLKLARAHGTTSVLDYGCGKGSLGEALPFPIQEYDPAIPGKSAPPAPVDIVVCTDVLEHIEPDCLDAVLADLARCTRKVGFFVIHNGPAKKHYADGRNAHLTQQPPQWWAEKLREFFDIRHEARGTKQTGFLVEPKRKG